MDNNEEQTGTVPIPSQILETHGATTLVQDCFLGLYSIFVLAFFGHCMFGHFTSLLERPNGRTFLDTAILGIALFLHFILLAIDYVSFFEIEMPPGEFEERWRNLWNPEADSSQFD